MREIIHIQIGRAGNAAGIKFWEEVCQEHGISPSGEYIGHSEYQLEKINVYFHMNRRKIYTPRGIAVDWDSGSIEDLHCSRYGRILKERNLVRGRRGGTGSNWAKGFYTEGKILARPVLDRVRREAEKCDCLDGFQIVHSIGGGTGSGLGSLIVTDLANEYPGRCLSTHTIFPSADSIFGGIQTYNVVLALQHLTENNVQAHCMDNLALERICRCSLGIPQAGFNSMNYLISTAMAVITTTNRFPGHLNEGVIKSSVNMIPFQRLHYLTVGYAPISPEGSKATRNLDDLKKELVDPKNFFIHPPIQGKYLTASYIFRGRVSQSEVDACLRDIFKKNRDKYVDWLPDNKKHAVCPARLRGLRLSVGMVGNTTAINSLFKRVLRFFDAIHQHKKYMHWFTGEGVSQDEMDAAGESLRELEVEYRKCEEAAVEDVWSYSGNSLTLEMCSSY